MLLLNSLSCLDCPGPSAEETVPLRVKACLSHIHYCSKDNPSQACPETSPVTLKANSVTGCLHICVYVCKYVRVATCVCVEGRD